MSWEKTPSRRCKHTISSRSVSFHPKYLDDILRFRYSYALLLVLETMAIEALFAPTGTPLLPMELFPRVIGILLLAIVTRLLLFLRSRSGGLQWILLLSVSGVSLSMALSLGWMVLFPDQTSASFILYWVIFYSYAPYILLCAAGILILNLAVYLLTATLRQANRLRTENALLKQSRMYEEKSGEILRKTVEETRELRHDTKQHLDDYPPRLMC